MSFGCPRRAQVALKPSIFESHEQVERRPALRRTNNLVSGGSPDVFGKHVQGCRDSEPNVQVFRIWLAYFAPPPANETEQ